MRYEISFIRNVLELLLSIRNSEIKIKNLKLKHEVFSISLMVYLFN